MLKNTFRSKAFLFIIINTSNLYASNIIDGLPIELSTQFSAMLSNMDQSRLAQSSQMTYFHVSEARKSATCEIKSSDLDSNNIRSYSQFGTISVNVDDVSAEKMGLISRLNNNIINLHFAYAPITDAGTANLQKLNTTETLDLCYTDITDASLQNIQDFNKLKTLDLSDTKITDAGLECIKELNNLVKLELYNTNVSAEMIIFFESRGVTVKR